MMNLVPREVCSCYPLYPTKTEHWLTWLKLDKLVITQTGTLAQSRLARGVKLNLSEATVRSPGRYLDILK